MARRFFSGTLRVDWGSRVSSLVASARRRFARLFRRFGVSDDRGSLPIVRKLTKGRQHARGEWHTGRRLRMEQLECRQLLSVSPVFVDSLYSLSTPGIGIDHFATIQAGINAVTPGGTVNVDDGTYAENVVINKPLTLVDTDAAATATSFTLTNGAVLGAGSGGVTAATVNVNQDGAAGTKIQDAITLVSSGGTVNVGDGTYAESVIVSNPVTICGQSESNVTVGGSSIPDAFVVDSSGVTIEDLSMTAGAASPTLLVEAGNLTLRNSTITATSAGAQDAISVTGGSADLGTTVAPGYNTVNSVAGSGYLVDNTSGSSVSAFGDTWQVNGLVSDPTTLMNGDVGWAGPVVTVDALVTNNSTPTLTGTVTDASPSVGISSVSVVISQSGSPVESLTATPSDGTWSVAATTLADGTYDVQATATDDGSNSNSVTAVGALTVDTAAPTLTISVSSPTNNATPTISGTLLDSTGGGGISSVSVVISNGDGTVESLTATPSDGNWSVPATTLADGDYTVTASVIDLAGDTQTASTGLTVDTAAPTVAVTPLLTDSSTPTLSGTVNDPSPSSGIATVTVTVDGQILSATVSGETWNVAVPVALDDGTYDVQVTAADNALVSNVAEKAPVEGLIGTSSVPAPLKLISTSPDGT